MKGQCGYFSWLLFLPLSAFCDQAENPLSISTAPSFWENYWYLPLVLAAVFFLFWMISNIRYRLKMKRLSEIRAVRKNAAQDFHDELGSKLSVISMYAQLAKAQLDGENFESAQYLEKVILTSNSLYGSMKDLLWTLNPEKDSLGELMYQLRDFGNELFDHSLINFAYRKPTKFEDFKLNMSLKRHILLIFKEAMNNSLKHSKGQNAMLQFDIQKDLLTVRYSDDGVGFSEKRNFDGDGLKNMKYRAEKINAELLVNSTKKGTSIVLKCDLKETGK